MSQTLDRALQILELIAEHPQRITDIAAALDVHHSTALRLIHTLRDHGFVTTNGDDRRFRLGAAMFRLANQALEGIDLRDVAKPHMAELSQKTGETVHLAILQERQVVYVDKVEARHPVRMYSRIGAAAPLHCSGVAKAVLMGVSSEDRNRLLDGYVFSRHTPNTHTDADTLLEELEVSKQTGFTRDNEEHEPGIHCIAAPIRSAERAAVGAVSITAPTSRLTAPQLLELVPDLLHATRAISSDLGAPL